MKKRTVIKLFIIGSSIVAGYFISEYLQQRFRKPKPQKVEMSSWLPVDNILDIGIFEIDKEYMATQIIDPSPKHGEVVVFSEEKIIDISALESDKNYYVRVWSDSTYSKIQFIHKI